MLPKNLSHDKLMTNKLRICSYSIHADMSIDTETFISGYQYALNAKNRHLANDIGIQKDINLLIREISFNVKKIIHSDEETTSIQLESKILHRSLYHGICYAAKQLIGDSKLNADLFNRINDCNDKYLHAEVCSQQYYNTDDRDKVMKIFTHSWTYRLGYLHGLSATTYDSFQVAAMKLMSRSQYGVSRK